jgi:hypothetical protein
LTRSGHDQSSRDLAAHRRGPSGADHGQADTDPDCATRSEPGIHIVVWEQKDNASGTTRELRIRPDSLGLYDFS